MAAKIRKCRYRYDLFAFSIIIVTRTKILTILTGPPTRSLKVICCLYIQVLVTLSHEVILFHIEILSCHILRHRNTFDYSIHQYEATFSRG